MITKIAFPTDVCDTVYTTATNYYKKGKQDTSNASDNVFSNSLANQGAFEVQGRLLHARNGLGLWDDTNLLELEALSNDAIVLLVELGEM